MSEHSTSPKTINATYDRRTLTYANSFDAPWQAGIIRTIEWLTGKITILRLVRQFEKLQPPTGAAFWRAILDTMGIELQTPASQIANIPKTGPVVVVSNHPHGLVDGMVLADVIGRVRGDYRILSRSILTGLDEEASSYMIAVPFPHDPDAQRKGVAMRAEAMAHLRAGGVVALFPSGVVSSSKTWFGPAVEAEWNVFTAKMIRRSGAAVLPMYFPGSNSRWYMIANRISPLLRQGLLLHEIVKALNKPQKPVIGTPLEDQDMTLLDENPRAFIEWLRNHVLGLSK